MATTARPPPPVPAHSRPRSPGSPAAGAARSLLLKISNAKASRLNPQTEQWDFLALGDMAVYQVSRSNAPSPSRTPPPLPATGGSGSAPPVPPRNSAAHSSGASTPSTSTLKAPLPTAASNLSAASVGIVIAVRNTEFPLASTTTVSFEEPNNYILDNGERFIVKIELDTPRDGSHEILDNIIRRYINRDGSMDSSGASTPELNPADFKNQLLLMDEATGKVLGPLNQNMPMSEGHGISGHNRPGELQSDQPVVVSFGGDEDPATAGQPMQVSAFDNLTSQYGKSDSRIVGAAEYVSKGILFAAEYGANSVSGAASNYTRSSKATETPMVFSDTTKSSVAKVASVTESAAKLSRKTVGFIGNKVEQFGGAAVRYGSKELETMGLIENDPKKRGGQPGAVKGFFRNTVQAGLLLADGVEKGSRHFLETGRQSTNTVVRHKYGEEAEKLTDTITSAGSNVVLVYVDARGVMHRALLKRVGKGALKARMQDGREVILDDSGLADQHTERDEQGNLIVIDEKEGYSTAIDGSERTGLQQRQGKAAPPVPPRH